MVSSPTSYDTLVLGAGAAGLFHAGLAAQRGRKCLVLDHARRPADKVRISGGGRCNFTNLETDAGRFLSQNPHFAKSALARYTCWDFISLMASHGLTYTEKHKGQLFCDQKSSAIIQMLLDECGKGGVDIRLDTHISNVVHRDGEFHVETEVGDHFRAPRLVVATGGLSIPKMGASGLAYDIARQFGHDIVDTRPGLVPYVFSGALGEQFANISGVAVAVSASVPEARFDEDLLFTHRGLSGPASLQTSSYWHPGETLRLDLVPGTDIVGDLIAAKQARPKQTLSAALEGLIPARLAALIADLCPVPASTRLADASHDQLRTVGAFMRDWTITPTGTEGYRTAEVTVGGVATDGLNQKTMESRHVPGLYFIGECVDVTGWLGGYNFQWAWASAHAAATG